MPCVSALTATRAFPAAVLGPRRRGERGRALSSCQISAGMEGVPSGWGADTRFRTPVVGCESGAAATGFSGSLLSAMTASYWRLWRSGAPPCRGATQRSFGGQFQRDSLVR